MTAMFGPIGIGPWVLVGVIVAQRLVELAVSHRHIHRVRALGAIEYGAGHFPFIVAVHVLFPILLIMELAVYGVHAGPVWPWWLTVWVLAQALRYTAVHALGVRWNTRVLVIPGMAPVRTGPYRWMRHPNYLAIVVEFVAAPMIFGAWRTAIVISLLNALALAIRIRCENGALQRAAVVSSR